MAAKKKTVVEKVMNKLFGTENWSAGSAEYNAVKAKVDTYKKSWLWWKSNAKKVFA